VGIQNQFRIENDAENDVVDSITFTPPRSTESMLHSSSLMHCMKSAVRAVVVVWRRVYCSGVVVEGISLKLSKFTLSHLSFLTDETSRNLDPLSVEVAMAEPILYIM